MNATAKTAEEWEEWGREPGDVICVDDREGNTLSILPVEVIQDLNVMIAVTPFMKSAIAYGVEGYDPEYYIDLCISGKAHLWAGITGSTLKGIMVTMKVDYPYFTVLRVIMCAGLPGSLNTFGALAWSALVGWAQQLGASKIEAWGRPGWERALQNYAKPEKKIEVLSYNVP